MCTISAAKTSRSIPIVCRSRHENASAGESNRGGHLTDTWNPAQYDKFQREREQPFFDLLALVQPAPGMRVVDLGCGTGKLTRELHVRLGARETIGIDRSARMLESARGSRAPSGLSVRTGTIEDFP